MESYCSKCDKVIKSSIKNIDETFNVKGDKIAITSKVAMCDDCGETIFNSELDSANLDLAYSVYRKKHNLLSPTDIANIRTKYGISQRSLSSLLEWGDITINRYENGAIQDPAHNEVLMLISNPYNMKELFDRNKQFLLDSVREKLENRIEQLIKNDSKSNFLVSLTDYISYKKDANEYSGFSRFDLEKMISMILCLVEKNKAIFTTKLNKLLWYADFMNYKTQGASISGSCYVHLPHGPVPNDYSWITAMAIEDGYLCSKEVIFPNGVAGVEYTALVPCDKRFFSKEEIKTIDFIADYFKNYNCNDIREKSHKEKGYMLTSDNEKISYKYAADLSIDFPS